MSKNPYFTAVLDRMQEIHDLKNSDYADDGNPYSNFEGAAYLTGTDVESVFHHLIGIKAERLRQIRSGKIPNFESLEDTIIDMANYAALWLSWRMKQEDRLETQPPLFTSYGEGHTGVQRVDPVSLRVGGTD